MKKSSMLTRMTQFQERFHEADKKLNPERHWLMKDSYSKDEALGMCIWCADHYEWDKALEYDARTDRYYKKETLK